MSRNPTKTNNSDGITLSAMAPGARLQPDC